MVLSLASAVAVVNISLMKMVTVMVTVVTAELESTGRRTTMKKVTLELLVDEIDNENIKSIEDDIRIELSNCYHNIEISSYKEVDYDPRWIRVKDREPVVSNKLRSENVYIRYGNDGPVEIAFMAWNTQWYDLNCDVIDKPDFWRYMTDDERPD
jgi:hypothetical protein|nr:MAG TPA: hypothetical protein [Caudoviricetes sp.]